ncbi:hypothetical protein ACFSR7_18675 [Cohnella sp. GCM10020058]|uniref:hypothetical protein n=1 Tax=Cohnella sp. GCM10020058 TaxID=3317330 RepID=UPI00364428B6
MGNRNAWIRRERFIVGFAPDDVQRELAKLRKRNERVNQAIEEERLAFGRLQTEKWAIREELRRQLSETQQEESRLLRDREPS